jgi:hypothetical protein
MSEPAGAPGAGGDATEPTGSAGAEADATEPTDPDAHGGPTLSALAEEAAAEAAAERPPDEDR